VEYSRTPAVRLRHDQTFCVESRFLIRLVDIHGRGEMTAPAAAAIRRARVEDPARAVRVLRLGVDVTVILTPPCIFCTDNN
jgi:hypothetical protein